MIGKGELNKAGEKVRVYHRAGNITVEGLLRQDEKYVWTHLVDEPCSACDNGTIPQSVKDGTHRSRYTRRGLKKKEE